MISDYQYGIRLSQRVDAKVLVTFNARNEHDRCKFAEDLRESISEMDEMENLRIDAELERQKKEGVTRKLCAFELQEKGIPRHGYEIVDIDGNKIGEVTSGTMSPVLKKGIGMGYVKPEYAKPGTDIYIQIRNKNLKAEVIKTPFRK